MGVGPDDERAPRFPQADIEALRLDAAGVVNEPDGPTLADESLDDLPRPIRAPAVDDDHLPVSAEIVIQEAFDRRPDPLLFVEA